MISLLIILMFVFMMPRELMTNPVRLLAKGCLATIMLAVFILLWLIIVLFLFL